AYNEVIGHYKTVVFGLGEVGLVAAVVFHALNGLRIILVDFWSGGTRHHRKMFWGVVALWVLLMAGFLPRHLMHMFGACDDHFHDPRPEHPIPSHRSARPQRPDDVVAVHAHVRRPAGHPRLRPPVREPVAGRGRPGHRLRLRRRQVDLAVLAGLGPDHVVAGPAARRQRRAHHHRGLRAQLHPAADPEGSAVLRGGHHADPRDPGDLHLRPLPGGRRTESAAVHLRGLTVRSRLRQPPPPQSFPVVIETEHFPDMQTHTYDVVIVGAGGAGMRAALESSTRARTAVVTKLYP